jgi:hypothetical protein
MKENFRFAINEHSNAQKYILACREHLCMASHTPVLNRL